jgi:hypothetical protein
LLQEINSCSRWSKQRGSPGILGLAALSGHQCGV